MWARGPSEQWRYDVIMLSQSCCDLFNEDIYRNGLYEYEKKRKKHAAVVDIRQCSKSKVSSAMEMLAQVQSYFIQNELTM